MKPQVKAWVDTPVTFLPDGNLIAIPLARERCIANDAGEILKVRAKPAERPAPAATRARVAAGAGHTCGILAGGTLWCWGANDEGQLGLGSYANECHPRRLTTLPWRAAAARRTEATPG